MKFAIKGNSKEIKAQLKLMMKLFNGLTCQQKVGQFPGQLGNLTAGKLPWFN